MTVDAPLGNAQFFVNTYDSQGVLLSGALSSPAPISGTATNTVTLTLNAAAQCVSLDGGSTLGGSFATTPLENQTSAQTRTFVVTPCDVDGNVIPAGQHLGNSLIFSTVNPVPPSSVGRKPAAGGRKPQASFGGPVSFSPSVITQGGPTTVTMTYAAGFSTSDNHYLEPTENDISVRPPYYATITTDPMYYILESDGAAGDVAVYVNSVLGTYNDAFLGYLATGGAPGHLVSGGPSSGCAQGGQALSAGTGNTGPFYSVFTVPVPTLADPTPMPSVATTAGSIGSPTATAIDSSCNVYIGTSTNAYALGSQMSSLGGALGPYFNSSPYNGFNDGFDAPVTALGAIGTSAYVGLGTDGGGYLNSLVDLNNTPSLYPGVATSIDAMTAYDAGDIALAYHNQSDGYLHFALFNGTALVHDDPMTGSNASVTAMVTDPNGNVWAVGNSGYLMQYTPGSDSVASKTFLNSGSPTGIALDQHGTIYVSDSGGAIDKYYWPYGSFQYSSLSGHASLPSSVTVFP
jgi:hypothetical protein